MKAKKKAKKKAEELVERFSNIKEIDRVGYGEPWYLMNKKEAKQCALICVDEIIEIIRYHGTDIGEKHSLFFWQQVKQELNNLTK